MNSDAEKILFGKKKKWAVKTEKGEVLEVFKSKITAKMWIPKLRLTKKEKLRIEEYD